MNKGHYFLTISLAHRSEQLIKPDGDKEKYDKVAVK